MRNQDIVVIDVESSGFGARSYPIEIAWKSEDGDFDSFLIKPHKRWNHWSKDAEERIHGISREQLFDEGISIELAAEKLNESLNGLRVYSDNAAFDEMWVQDIFLFSKEQPRYEFSIKQVDNIYPLMGSYDTVSIFNSLLKNTEITHRALEDCERFIKALNKLWPNGLKGA